MKVFVSYTIRDDFISKDYLESIEIVVTEFGKSFIDLLHNKSNEKQEFVKRELLSSNVILLIVSKSINLSPWVMWEIEQAKRAGIPIIEVTATESGLLDSLLEIKHSLSKTLTSQIKRDKNSLQCFVPQPV